MKKTIKTLIFRIFITTILTVLIVASCATVSFVLGKAWEKLTSGIKIQVTINEEKNEKNN